jgi:ribosome biogenesis ATPase
MFDFNALAKATPGYVCADLNALAGAASIIAVKRISDGTIVIPVFFDELDELGPRCDVNAL